MDFLSIAFHAVIGLVAGILAVILGALLLYVLMVWLISLAEKYITKKR